MAITMTTRTYEALCEARMIIKRKRLNKDEAQLLGFIISTDDAAEDHEYRVSKQGKDDPKALEIKTIECECGFISSKVMGLPKLRCFCPKCGREIKQPSKKCSLPWEYIIPFVAGGISVWLTLLLGQLLKP